MAREIWEYLLADMDSPIEPMDIVNRPYPQSLFCRIKRATNEAMAATTATIDMIPDAKGILPPRFFILGS